MVRKTHCTEYVPPNGKKIPGRVSRAFRDAFPVLAPGVTLGTAAAELRASCGPVHWIDCLQNIPERPQFRQTLLPASSPRPLRCALLSALRPPPPHLRLSHGKALAHLQNPAKPSDSRAATTGEYLRRRLFMRARHWTDPLTSSEALFFSSPSPISPDGPIALYHPTSPATGVRDHCP